MLGLSFWARLRINLAKTADLGCVGGAEGFNRCLLYEVGVGLHDFDNAGLDFLHVVHAFYGAFLAGGYDEAPVVSGGGFGVYEGAKTVVLTEVAPGGFFPGGGELKVLSRL